MKNKLILFDKDGTLTESISGAKFIKDPTDQKPKFNFSKLPKETNDSLYVYGICTNQMGIMLGYKTKDFLCKEIDFLIHNLGFNADIFLCCPDEGKTLWTADVETCRPVDTMFDVFSSQYKDHFGIPQELIGSFRKPDCGMIKASPFLYNYVYGDAPINFDEIIFIGDMESDRKASEKAGCKYWDINDCLQINYSIKFTN